MSLPFEYSAACNFASLKFQISHQIWVVMFPRIRRDFIKFAAFWVVWNTHAMPSAKLIQIHASRDFFTCAFPRNRSVTRIYYSGSLWCWPFFWFLCHFHRCTTSVKCKRWRTGGEPKQRRNREFCTPGSVNSNKCWWCLVGVTALYDRCSNAVTPFSDSNLHPLHPTISMHILHTALQTFPKALTRRICLLIKSFFRWWSFPLFSWP